MNQLTHYIILFCGVVTCDNTGLFLICVARLALTADCLHLHHMSWGVAS